MPRPTAVLLRRLLAAVAAVSTIATALPALADGLKQGRQGEYTLVSGGVNSAEIDELGKLAQRYQIQLRFRQHGEPAGLAGVKVRVFNTAGDLVVETTAVGPHLYVNPPAGGRFTIEAEHEGETLKKTRDLVGRRYLQLDFEFGSGAPAQ